MAQDDSLENVFEQIRTTFGRLDFVLHSVASCPKQDLRGHVTDCSRDRFVRAMDTSVYSFIRMAALAEISVFMVGLT
jgi:enoyl-[acyl-carrier protein] reductase I